MKGLVVALVLAVTPALPSSAQDPGAPPGAPSRVPARLTLAEALRIAEARSPIVLAARARAAIAEAEVLGARARPNPTLSVESRGYPLFEGDRPSVLDHQELTVSIDQEVESGARRQWRRQAAQLGVDVARAGGRDDFRRLRLDVQRAYFQAVLAKADHGAMMATLDDVDKVVAINRARYELGELSGVEMRRLQVERHRFADEVAVTDLALRNARSRLLALLDLLPLDQDFDTADALSDGPVGAPVMPGSAAGPPLHRTDVEALRLAEHRAEADAGLQRALRIPPFSIGAGWQRDFGANAVVLRATVPLPIRNRNEAGVARADAERALAAGRTAAATTAAALEVQLAANAVGSSRRRVSYISTEYMKTAREARDIVLDSYRAGASTLIDYLDAQRALRDAQRAENRALFDYRVSVFELEAALGASFPPRP
jgi:outer membrane protein, heavy metal efflux system